MSWVITDPKSLQGTCYMEVLPGKYCGKCWNAESTYFEEEHFGFLEEVIARHWPQYDHYAFNEINALAWHNIISDMEAIERAITGGARTDDLGGQIRFNFTPSRDKFIANEAANLVELRDTIDEFTHWLRRQLDAQETISVLGM
jgi:hypothetical protein